MAEGSVIWDSTGVGDGPSTGHTEAQLAKLVAALSGADGEKGFIPGVLQELAPSLTGGGTTITLGTGYAVVDNKIYWNDSAIVYDPPNPTVGNTGKRIVLRCSNTGQTVRLTHLASADGTAGLPALTQVPGGTYDIPWVDYVQATSGAITMTDARKFASSAGERLIASDKTERTTTNNGLATLCTFSSLAIPADVPIIIRGMARKTTGAAAVCILSVSLNGTSIFAGIAIFTAANSAQQGQFEIRIPPRITNYLQAAIGETDGGPTGGGSVSGNRQVYQAGVDAPAVTITEILLRGGNSGNTANTLAVKDVGVYVGAL